MQVAPQSDGTKCYTFRSPVVTVSFDQPSYTVLESESVMITLSLDRGIASNFFVEVRAG